MMEKKNEDSIQTTTSNEKDDNKNTNSENVKDKSIGSITRDDEETMKTQQEQKETD